MNRQDSPPPCLFLHPPTARRQLRSLSPLVPAFSFAISARPAALCPLEPYSENISERLQPAQTHHPTLAVLVRQDFEWKFRWQVHSFEEALGFALICAPYQQPHAKICSKQWPLAAAIVRLNHRFDAIRFERRTRQLCFGPERINLRHNQIVQLFAMHCLLRLLLLNSTRDAARARGQCFPSAPRPQFARPLVRL